MTARIPSTIRSTNDAVHALGHRRRGTAPAAGLVAGCALGIAAVLALPAALGVPAAHATPLSLVGQSAPDFALPAVAGDNVRLSESLGQPVILSFWGSHCAECAAQLGRLDRLYDTYRSSGLVVLAVSVDDDMERARRYARAHPMHYPVLLDAAKSVSRAYAIDRLPTTVLIDRSGVVRYLHDRYRANDPSYVTQIRALLDDESRTDTASATATASVSPTQSGNP